MHESIIGKREAGKVSERESRNAQAGRSGTAAGGALDINREKRAAENKTARTFPSFSEPKTFQGNKKRTEKQSPERNWSPEEKREYKHEQLRKLSMLTAAARAIAYAYTNEAGLDEDEAARRGRVFGSSLKCGRHDTGTAVDLVRYADGRVGLSGVWRCHSPWCCPECVSRDLYWRSRRIVALFEAIQKENEARRKAGKNEIVVLFATFTAPHYYGEKLARQMDILAKAWTGMQNGSQVRTLKKKYGCKGTIRCFDHTVAIHEDGRRNWHAHLHCLFVFDDEEGRLGEADDGTRTPALEMLCTGLYSAWRYQVQERYGDGRQTSRRAFDAEVVDLYAREGHSAQAVADYAAKMAALPAYLLKSQKARPEDWDPDKEAKERLSPWDLLELSQNHILAAVYDYAGAWVEYCEATKDARRMHTSRNLFEAFGVGEVARPEPVSRHVLPGAVADAALSDLRFLDELKDALSAGDVSEVEEVLDRKGLDLYSPAVVELAPLLEHKPEARRDGDRYRQARDLDPEAHGEKNKEAARRLAIVKQARLQKLYDEDENGPIPF